MNRSQKAAVLSIGQASTFVLTLGLAMILARMLSQDEYAAYLKALMVYKVAAPILILGLPSAIYYFIPQKGADPVEVLNANLACSVILALGFILIIFSGGAELIAGFLNSPSLALNLKYLAPYVLGIAPLMALGPCLMTQGQAVRSAGMSILSRAVIFLTVMGWVYFRGPSATNAIIGQTVGAFLVVWLVVYLMFRSLDGRPAWPSWQSMKKQLCYSAPLAVSTIVATLFLQTDKAVVARMVSEKAFAIFATGAFELPIFAMMTGAITAVIMVDLRTKIIESNFGDALQLWKSANIKTMQIVLPIGVILFCCRYELMELAFGSAYRASGTVFGVYLLLVPIRCIGFQSLILASGQSKAVMMQSVVSLFLNAILTVVLVRWIGVVGAAISTVLVVILWSVPYCIVHIAKGCQTSVRDVSNQPRVVRMTVVAVLACLCWWPIEIVMSGFEVPLFVRVGCYSLLSGILVMGLFFVFRAATFGQYRALAQSAFRG